MSTVTGRNDSQPNMQRLPNQNGLEVRRAIEGVLQNAPAPSPSAALGTDTRRYRIWKQHYPNKPWIEFTLWVQRKWRELAVSLGAREGSGRIAVVNKVGDKRAQEMFDEFVEKNWQ